MSYFIGIVDGTGEINDTKYTEDMKNSFCVQVAQATPNNSLYLRGPSGDGIEIESRALKIVKAVMAAEADRVYLAGFSRGGSIVVIAAKMLQERGRSVAALFLFDPVARHFSASSDQVPANVATAYVARRAIGAKAMDKYDYMTLGSLAGHNPVRNWFGTTARNFESNGTRRQEATFICSHSAIGGVGWIGISEDLTEVPNVAGFFNQALTEERLPARLIAYAPSARA